MAGQEVTRNDLDYKMSQTLVAARNVLREIETINAFLERTPADANGVDPLTLPFTPVEEGAVPGRFGYTEAEAYVIRSTFQQLAGMKSALDPILTPARALTGLI